MPDGEDDQGLRNAGKSASRPVGLEDIEQLADAVIAANGVGTELIESYYPLCAYANEKRSLLQAAIHSGERSNSHQSSLEYFYWRHIESNLLLIWKRGYRRSEFKSHYTYQHTVENGEGRPDKVLSAALDLRRIVPELRKLLSSPNSRVLPETAQTKIAAHDKPSKKKAKDANAVFPSATSAGGAHPNQGKVQAAPSETKTGAGIVLHEDAMAILKRLEASPIALKHDSLGRATRRAKNTVQRHINELKRLGFIYFPHGDRSGAVITDVGRAFIDTSRSGEIP